MYSLTDVFKIYVNNYKRILTNFYPSLNSTGFQERNLSVNFSKAYETIYSNSVSWFEFQINSKEHIDSIIIDENNKIILLIESKRISSRKKIEEIINDINRINYICSENKINDISSSKKERIPNIKSYEIFGLILADIWLEENWKKELAKTGLISEEDHIRFKVLNPLAKSKISSTTIENYRLLYYLFKAKNKEQLK